jgi:hypothetical protein
MQIVLHYIYNFHTRFGGLLRILVGHSTETAVTQIGDFIVDFLCELEAIFKNAI